LNDYEGSAKDAGVCWNLSERKRLRPLRDASESLTLVCWRNIIEQVENAGLPFFCMSGILASTSPKRQDQPRAAGSQSPLRMAH
jgi:hypothetical protein